jgi:Holliday junction DNA helicase RuvA
MITRVRGRLIERELDRVTIEVGGVGLDIAVSAQTRSKLPELEQEVTLYTYLAVREDALALYGFRSVEERQAFLLCLSVQQVGPKLAMSILSSVDADGLASMVRSGDHARLRKIPGVGQKTAERLVLELKDKMDRLGVGLGGKNAPAVIAKPGALSGPPATVAVALVNLGYKLVEAERAAKDAAKAAPSESVELLLTRALRILAE